MKILLRINGEEHETDVWEGESLLYALRERNLPRIANVYRDAFSEVKAPSEGLRQALDHLDRYFRR